MNRQHGRSRGDLILNPNLNPHGRGGITIRIKNKIKMTIATQTPGRVSPWLAVLLFTAGPCLAADGGAQAPSAAKVENAVKEADLSTVKLSPDAEKRLGIATAAVAKRAFPRHQLFPGEIVLLLATDGTSVSAQPVLGASPEEFRRVTDLQADADGKVNEARTNVAAAETATKRAEQMMADKAGSQRAVDEARAIFDLAKAVLLTAETRRSLLGTPVADAAKDATRWIRTTVAAADLARIDPAAPARVTALSDRRGAGTEAKRVAAPASANALAGTVDVFYEITAPPAEMQIGQRVAVSVPVRGTAGESLVVPHSAVVHDFNGGAWVYEQTAPLTYVRRRVFVERVSGQDAILANGPAVGVKVVTAGAAELFGTEFGSGK